jgi:pimeloyl-ACP methyl ester carboxylesterase
MIRLLSTLLLLVGAAAAYLTLAWFVQRAVTFPAPPARPRVPLGDAEIVRLEQPAGVVEALYLSPMTGADGPASLLIFFHGNAELADFWVEPFQQVRHWGWGVLLVEYPGYGRSAGRPSEATIRAVALAAHDWALGDPRVDGAQIVAYGRSLGGGPAAWLASERQLAGLVLESSFTSVRALARRFLVPGPLVRDPFDNLAALARFRGPLLVLHGRHDTLIPVAHGRALAAAVPGAALYELNCGHNDCPRPWREIRAFLDRISPPAR